MVNINVPVPSGENSEGKNVYDNTYASGITTPQVALTKPGTSCTTAKWVVVEQVQDKIFCRNKPGEVRKDERIDTGRNVLDSGFVSVSVLDVLPQTMSAKIQREIDDFSTQMVPTMYSDPGDSGMLFKGPEMRANYPWNTASSALGEYARATEALRIGKEEKRRMKNRQNMSPVGI